MKLLLTSAGLTNDNIANALEQLAGRSLNELSIAFIITASIQIGDDKSWLIDNLIDIKNRNFKSVDILDVSSLKEHEWKKRLEVADVICVGGGNEIYLAEVFDKIGMKDHLLYTLSSNSDVGNNKADKIYMGISAGSMVAGINLPSAPYDILFRDIEDYGSHVVPSMGLVNLSYIPHLNSEYFKFTKVELESLRGNFTIYTYATDDNTAIMIDGEKIKIVGDGDYWSNKV